VIKIKSFEKEMERIKQLVLDRPVRRGEVIVENIENMNANLIATSSSYNLVGGKANVDRAQY